MLKRFEKLQYDGYRGSVDGSRHAASGRFLRHHSVARKDIIVILMRLFATNSVVVDEKINNEVVTLENSGIRGLHNVSVSDNTW